MGFFKTLFGDHPSQKLTTAIRSSSTTTVEEIPAEVIHAEVDKAEEIFLNQIKAILTEKASNKVDIEKKEIDKSYLLSSLGFKNSQLIKEVSAKKELNERIEAEIKLNNETVDLFQKYKDTYPTEKVIPFTEFEKVLKKYNLIYAPVQAYVKDVPEKNLMEIRDAKKTNSEHKMAPLYYITEVKNYYSGNNNTLAAKVSEMLNHNNELRFHNSSYYHHKNNKLYVCSRPSRHSTLIEADDFLLEELYRKIKRRVISLNDFDIQKDIIIPESIGTNIYVSLEGVFKHIDKFDLGKHFCSNYINYSKSYLYLETTIESSVSFYSSSHINRIKTHLRDVMKVSDSDMTNLYFKHGKISKEGLFIAAPKTHFDMSTLTKVENYGYYCESIGKVKAIDTKDPIAFEFLQGNDKYREGFVRIISKWGTADDQSYLDPIVQDERNN